MSAMRNYLAVVVTVLGVCAGADAEWTAPVPVSEINTAYDEGAPFLTYDGLTLYFSRQNLPGEYPGRLFSATRSGLGEPFGAEQELTGLRMTGSIINYAWVSPDNLRQYYYQTAGMDHFIMRTERGSTAEAWSMGSPVAELNALGGVANPSLTPDELTIVFTGTAVAGGVGGYDLWIGTRPDRSSPFGNFRNLTELNSTAWDFHPRLSADGLTLYFASERSGQSQLYTATRPSLDAPFGAPESLAEFYQPGVGLEYPAISADGQTLYFTEVAWDRSFDIYVSYNVVPVPGALLLGSLGLGLFHMLRTRRVL